MTESEMHVCNNSTELVTHSGLFGCTYVRFRAICLLSVTTQNALPKWTVWVHTCMFLYNLTTQNALPQWTAQVHSSKLFL